LSVSPLLLEKYMQAAQAIVTRAVPRVAPQPPEQIIWGHDFHAVQGAGNGQRLSFYQDAICFAPLKPSARCGS